MGNSFCRRRIPMDGVPGTVHSDFRGAVQVGVLHRWQGGPPAVELLGLKGLSTQNDSTQVGGNLFLQHAELGQQMESEVFHTRAVTFFSSRKSMRRVGKRKSFLGMMWVVAPHFSVR